MLSAGCGPRASSIKGNVEGYDFDHPSRIDLPTALNEISGLWYYPKDTSLFAIVDEYGFLYKIFPKYPDRILRWKFAGMGDYEDIVLVDGVFYILRSDGAIYATTILSGTEVKTVLYDAPQKGDEYESLYYDKDAGLLVLVCKDCKADDKKRVSTIGFNPATRTFVPGPFVIQSEQLAAIMGENKIQFKPSATTLNPFTGQLMMVSAVNSLLVFAGRDGGIHQAYPIGTKLYKQPEGIAVGADRTLYISNEWAKKGNASILVMPYRAKK
jgi:hypothetical protein